MKVSDAVPALIGDISRFGELADRVEGLVETQVNRLEAVTAQWVILPWENGFYLFSENSEGQRQGREVTQAFLGPSMAVVEGVNEEYLRRTFLPNGRQRAC